MTRTKETKEMQKEIDLLKRKIKRLSWLWLATAAIGLGSTMVSRAACEDVLEHGREMILRQKISNERLEDIVNLLQAEGRL